jgi:outer membrane protein TolC
MRNAARIRAAVVCTSTLLGCGALALSFAVHGQTLTLAEAQRRAIERSHQISAHDAATVASREMAVAARELPDPALTLGIDNLPTDGPDQFSLTRDFMTMRRIGLMQEFTRSEKRRLRSQRFEREADKAQAEKTATIASIQRETALAWLDRYYAETMAALIADQVKEVKREILATESAYRAARGSQADVFAVHSALVALEDRASEFERRVRTAKTNLARWVGEAANASLEGKPGIDSIRLDTAALDAQLAGQPQIAVLTRQEEIARTEARIAQANKKADWSLEVMYSVRGPSFSNMASVAVSIPLQWDQKDRQNRELAAKLAMADQAKAERDEMLRAQIGEVRAMVQEWESGRERLPRYERELIPLARERTRAAFAAYQGGKAALTDLLLARRDEIDVRMQAVQLEMDTARVWAQLNFLFPENAPGIRAPATSTANKIKESQ